MSQAIAFSTVADTDMNALVIAYNAAYSDYILPIQATPQTLMQIQQVSDVSFSASQVAWLDEKIIGFGFLGIRGERGWVSSIAVLPPYRRRGVGRALMFALAESAKLHGVTHLQLEVNEDNAIALTLYDGLGFRRIRRILSVGCDEPPAKVPNLHVQDTISSRLMPHYADYHSMRPNWAREAPSLRQFDYLTWTVGSQARPTAYAMGYVWGEVITFVDLGFLPGKEADLTALLGGIHHLHPNSICRMMSICEDEPAWPILAALGYEEVMAEYEMACDDVDSLLRMR